MHYFCVSHYITIWGWKTQKIQNFMKHSWFPLIACLQLTSTVGKYSEKGQIHVALVTCGSLTDRMTAQCALLRRKGVKEPLRRAFVPHRFLWGAYEIIGSKGLDVPSFFTGSDSVKRGKQHCVWRCLQFFVIILVLGARKNWTCLNVWWPSVAFGRYLYTDSVQIW